MICPCVLPGTPATMPCSRRMAAAATTLFSVRPCSTRSKRAALDTYAGSHVGFRTPLLPPKTSDGLHDRFITRKKGMLFVRC